MTTVYGAMRTPSSSAWSRRMYGQLEKKAKSLVAVIQSSTKGTIAVFLLLVALVFFVSTRGLNGANYTSKTSWSQQRLSLPTHDQDPSKSQLKQTPKQAFHDQQFRRPQAKPITLDCPTYTVAQTCQRLVSPLSSPSLNPLSSQPSPSCPDYFRWIHEDLHPWSSTGITREMVESAKKFATFRLVVLDGRVYVEEYFGKYMTRNVFSLWGILQLVYRYPGRIPDLDLMFNCMDQPAIKIADYLASTPPPLFHYCKDDKTMDILFPDWSFWGWPETNIKPWGPLIEEMKNENSKLKWRDREPYAFWKGNPLMGGNRQDLMKCNVSNGREWNARLYTQDWNREVKEGFKTSNLARQCHHRYKIYVEGFAWSVSQKYILACDSPTLLILPRFEEFFTRGLIPGQHYWPILENDKCRSIKSAVDWGNQHQEEAQAMGKAGSGFVQEGVKMDNVYDYMLHVLEEYSKLLGYKPSIPENATEICLESMACSAFPGVKEFLFESMVTQTHEAEPCTMPPPFTPVELQDIVTKKANSINQVEMWARKSSG